MSQGVALKDFGDCMRAGGLFEGQGRWIDAIGAYWTALQFSPKDPDAHVALANAIARGSSPEIGLQALVAARRYAQSNASLEFRIAETQTFLGSYDEAVPFFERAVALNPEWLEAREVLGRALWICNRPVEARSVWSSWRDEQARIARQRGIDPSSRRLLDTIWSGWFGNNAHLDAYIKAIELGWYPRTKVQLLAPRGQVSNPAYVDAWKKYVDVIDDPAEVEVLKTELPYLSDSLHTFVLNGEPTYYFDAMQRVQAEWDRLGKEPLLQLSPEDERRGQETLRKLGVPAGAWFVVLHVREGGYWKEGDEPTNVPKNAAISTYRQALQKVAEAGGWVLRFGDPSMTPVHGLDNVIDYSSSPEKADWMDLFLCAKARFMIGTNSGPYFVCATYGVPALLTNWIPLSKRPMQRTDIFLPKLFRRTSEGRNLSISEMLKLPRDIWSGRYFRRNGLEIVDNLPEEISAAVEQMLEQTAIGGHAADETEFEKRLNARMTTMGVNGQARLGVHFTRNHPELL